MPDTANLVGQLVEYRTSLVDVGIGVVVSHDENTGMLVVVDDDDGSRWTGQEDHVTVCAG